MIFNARISDIVTQAAILNREIKERSAKLDVLKEKLRNEALKISTKRGEDEQLEFDSPEGVATVCFVRDAAAIIKGADPLTLRQYTSFPLDTWHRFFATRIVLTDEFTDAYTLLAKTDQKLINKVVEWKERDPRVTLPR